MASRNELLDELLKDYKTPEDLLGKNFLKHRHSGKCCRQFLFQCLLFWRISHRFQWKP